MITVKLNDVVNSISAMRDLATQPLRARAAFQTLRLLKEVERAYGDYEEQRRNLVEKFAVRDENGELVIDENNNCKIIPESINEFNTQYQELMNGEIEINCEPIGLDYLEDITFTPAQMAQLEPFIE